MSDTRRQDDIRDFAILKELAAAANIQPGEFLAAVRRQLTSIKSEITNGDIVALFYTAKEFGLNPLRREVSLIDTKAGPRVYVTFDGWLRCLMAHPNYITHKWTYHWANDKVGTVAVAVTFHIKRKLKDGTVEWFDHTELLQECRVTNDYSPWNKYPVRMLAEKAAMQGTRFCFGMYVPTEDEVLEADAMERAAEQKAPPAPGHVGPAVPLVERGLPEPAPRESIDFSAATRVTPESVTVDAKIDTLPTAARQERAKLPEWNLDESRALDKQLAQAEGFEDLDLG